MLKRYRLILITIIMAWLVILSGCNGTAYQKSIYDDDTKIAGNDNNLFIKNIRSTTGDSITQRFGTFYGQRTIVIIEAKRPGTVDVDFDCQIDKGRFKVVVVSPDDQVTTTLEQSKKGSTTLSLQKGIYKIKIVGDAAGGNLRYTATPNGDVSIRFPDDGE